MTEPGIISQAFTRFHNYSMGNQLLAWCQCERRGIAPGPIGTFMRWKELGRHVKKGEKAITLCMPVTGKRSAESKNDETGKDEKVEIGYTRFVYKNNWFVLSQTDGKEYEPEPYRDGMRTRRYPHWASSACRLRCWTESAGVRETSYRSYQSDSGAT